MVVIDTAIDSHMERSRIFCSLAAAKVGLKHLFVRVAGAAGEEAVRRRHNTGRRSRSLSVTRADGPGARAPVCRPVTTAWLAAARRSYSPSLGMHPSTSAFR